MTNLGDKKTHEAWENFQKYLVSVGSLNDLNQKFGSFEVLQREKARHNFAQMAFKQGFTAGALSMLAEPMPPQEEEQKVSSPRNTRTDEERKEDGQALEIILPGDHSAISLSSIVKGMHELGHTHWNTRNGSGFINLAIRDGYAVERVGHGLYALKEVAE